MSCAESMRRDREIAALGADAVAEVAALVGRVGVGRQFDRVDAGSRCCTASAAKRTSSNTKNSASGPKKTVSPMPVDLR